MPAAQTDLVPVGEVLTAHGLGGLVRVRPYQPDSPALVAGRDVIVAHGGGSHPTRLTSVAAHGRGRLLVGLAGVADRTQAEALAGARLCVAAASLPPPGPDEFYHHEVLGFAVETDAGRVLGRVAGTISTGLNDVLVVRDGAVEHLIPVIADVVRIVDRAERRIVVTPIPGLLE